MASSMYVPLSQMPADMDEARLLVHAACSDFGYSLPKISYETKDLSSTSLENGFIVIEGAEPGEQCWVSISRCTPEVTEDDERTILADVKTRRDWVFAGVVAYAFCRYAGKVVLNDAGALDGQEHYSLEALGAAIRKLKAET